MKGVVGPVHFVQWTGKATDSPDRQTFNVTRETGLRVAELPAQELLLFQLA